MTNERLIRTIGIALHANISSREVLLDCYNKSVAKNGICYTITTRINTSNHYYVMEFDERVLEDTAGYEAGLDSLPD